MRGSTRTSTRSTHDATARTRCCSRRSSSASPTCSGIPAAWRRSQSTSAAGSATGPELEELERAAQLHDIGKIAVPDQILRKPGALTDDEWVFIRQHTLVGQRILAASPALRRIGDIVRATHERWDGAGYPDGVAGTTSRSRRGSSPSAMRSTR